MGNKELGYRPKKTKKRNQTEVPVWMPQRRVDLERRVKSKTANQRKRRARAKQAPAFTGGSRESNKSDTKDTEI